jgi:hypothetical protein
LVEARNADFPGARVGLRSVASAALRRRGSAGVHEVLGQGPLRLAKAITMTRTAQRMMITAIRGTADWLRVFTVLFPHRCVRGPSPRLVRRPVHVHRPASAGLRKSVQRISWSECLAADPRSPTDDAPENQSDTVIPQAVTNSAPAGHLLMGEQDERFAVQLRTDVFAVLQMVAAGCGCGTSDRPDTERTADAHQGTEPATSR